MSDFRINLTVSTDLRIILSNFVATDLFNNVQKNFAFGLGGLPLDCTLKVFSKGMCHCLCDVLAMASHGIKCLKGHKSLRSLFICQK